MVTEPNQRRISSVLTRVACGFSTFILAVILSTHYNQLGPNISRGDLDSQLFPIVVAKMEIPVGTRIIAEQLTIAQFPRNVAIEGAFQKIDDNLLGRVALARIMPREPITESSTKGSSESSQEVECTAAGFARGTVLFGKKVVATCQIDTLP